MTTRELITILLLNANMDDPVSIEVKIPETPDATYLSYEPAYVSHICGDVGDRAETLIECKPWRPCR